MCVFTQKGRNVSHKSFLHSFCSYSTMFLAKRVIYFMHADSVYLKCKYSHKKPKTNLVITTTSTCNGYFLESMKGKKKLIDFNGELYHDFSRNHSEMHR